MKDCIKIEEIKMFLETGLMIICNETWHYKPKEDSVISEFVGLDSDGEIITKRGFFTIDDIKPLVKPLSSLTFEDLENLGNRYDVRIIDEDNAYLFRDEDGLRNPLEWSFQDINYLASKHYDIFNWIGRGLAEEIK